MRLPSLVSYTVPEVIFLDMEHHLKQIAHSLIVAVRGFRDNP
jgi:hypothetical protein